MIEVEANRKATKWTTLEQVKRVLWALSYWAFYFSPRPMWGWRRTILRVFGAQIGRNVHVYPSVRVTIPWNLRLEDHCAIGDRAILYSLGLILVGARATVSQGAHLCAGTHDWRDPAMPLLKPPIEIGPDAWVCADAFVGPGVSVGARAIVGARGVVTRDVEADSIMAGNPARKIGKRTP